MGKGEGEKMRCPKCGNKDLQIISEIKTKGKDFYLSRGICGRILFGPTGILCGTCGKGKRISSQAYWVCSNCGNKFKA